MHNIFICTMKPTAKRTQQAVGVERQNSWDRTYEERRNSRDSPTEALSSFSIASSTPLRDRPVGCRAIVWATILQLDLEPTDGPQREKEKTKT